MPGVVAIVLAGGQGKRLKSRLPKVLHRLCGVPMVAHVVRAAQEAGASRVVVVVGHGREAVEQDLAALTMDALAARSVVVGVPWASCTLTAPAPANRPVPRTTWILFLRIRKAMPWERRSATCRLRAITRLKSNRRLSQ